MKSKIKYVYENVWLINIALCPTIFIFGKGRTLALLPQLQLIYMYKRNAEDSVPYGWELNAEIHDDHCIKHNCTIGIHAKPKNACVP
jgi:hypothetical protein